MRCMCVRAHTHTHCVCILCVHARARARLFTSRLPALPHTPFLRSPSICLSLLSSSVLLRQASYRAIRTCSSIYQAPFPIELHTHTHTHTHTHALNHSLTHTHTSVCCVRADTHGLAHVSLVCRGCGRWASGRGLARGCVRERAHAKPGSAARSWSRGGTNVLLHPRTCATAAACTMLMLGRGTRVVGPQSTAARATDSARHRLRTEAHPSGSPALADPERRGADGAACFGAMLCPAPNEGRDRQAPACASIHRAQGRPRTNAAAGRAPPPLLHT